MLVFLLTYVGCCESLNWDAWTLTFIITLQVLESQFRKLFGLVDRS
ncbi:hypothetical protein BH11CYA1_BH11CYA1_45520 [soil metagenome]